MIASLVGLFRKSEEKLAVEAAAQEEIKRLKALSTEELAVVVLPGLGPEVVAPGHHVRAQHLCEYLLSDFPGLGRTRPLMLMAPVRRALERLRDAGLVSSMSYDRSPLWRITEDGTGALADKTVEDYLAGTADSRTG